MDLGTYDFSSSNYIACHGRPFALDTNERVEWANRVRERVLKQMTHKWELGDSCWYRPVYAPYPDGDAGTLNTSAVSEINAVLRIEAEEARGA